MPSFMENWLKRKYDLVEEADTIERLMYGNKLHVDLFIVIANENFLSWDLRNNTISTSDFEEKSGIGEKLAMIHSEEPNEVDINLVMEYFEYALNLSRFVYQHAGDYAAEKVIKTRCSAIRQNIKSIVEQCGYEIIEKSSKALVIVIKDAIADMASDIVDGCYNLSEDIFIYRHRSVSGNLINKADILVRMGKYVEKEIKPNVKGKANLRQLESNVGFLINALDLRHPPNEKEKPVIKELVEKGGLEKRYDDLYMQIVSLIVLFDCTQKQNDIEKLKQLFNPVK